MRLGLLPVQSEPPKSGVAMAVQIAPHDARPAEVVPARGTRDANVDTLGVELGRPLVGLVQSDKLVAQDVVPRRNVVRQRDGVVAAAVAEEIGRPVAPVGGRTGDQPLVVDLGPAEGGLVDVGGAVAVRAGGDVGGEGSLVGGRPAVGVAVAVVGGPEEGDGAAAGDVAVVVGRGAVLAADEVGVVRVCLGALVDGGEAPAYAGGAGLARVEGFVGGAVEGDGAEVAVGGGLAGQEGRGESQGFEHCVGCGVCRCMGFFLLGFFSRIYEGSRTFH